MLVQFAVLCLELKSLRDTIKAIISVVVVVVVIKSNEI